MTAAWLLSVILAADAVTLTTKPQTLEPELPSLTIVVHSKIAGAVLSLTRSDGERVVERLDATDSLKRQVALKQPVGVAFSYEGSLHVEFDDGSSGDVPVAIAQALMSSPLNIETFADAADIKARRFYFRISRTPADVSLKLFGKQGQALGDLTLVPERDKRGYVVHWPETDDPVLFIVARFTDKTGLWRDMKLWPWSLDVPHEEVLFATNKAEVLQAEKPKLDQALSRIVTAVNEVKDHAAVTLYVLGHTDTVGGTEDNQRLSMARARSIAAYFKARGFSAPIRYAGAGESMLMVATKDQQDEPRNRRVQYIVSIDPPALPSSTQWNPY